MEDEDYRPRPADLRVEPLLAGLAGPEAGREPAAKGAGRRRGCGAGALLALALAAFAWLLAAPS